MPENQVMRSLADHLGFTIQLADDPDVLMAGLNL
jgi:hypothetical protein